MRRQTFSSAIGKTLQYRNQMSLRKMITGSGSPSGLSMLTDVPPSLLTDTSTDFKCTLYTTVIQKNSTAATLNQPLFHPAGGNRIPLCLQYRVSEKHSSSTPLYTHSLKTRMSGPSGVSCATCERVQAFLCLNFC